MNDNKYQICKNCIECIYSEDDDITSLICFATQNDKCECKLIYEVDKCPLNKW